MAKPLFSLKLLGAKKLERKLTALGKRLGGKALRDATKEAMEPVAKLARSRAPVHFGRLKASIKVATLSRKSGAQGAQVRTGTRKQLRIDQKTPYYYPASIEYGTRDRAADSFLRSSMGDLKGQVIRSFSGILKKFIEAKR